MLKHSGALYIDGEWITASTHEAVINPATEAVIGMAPVGDAAAIEAALTAARTAFDKGPWPRMTQPQRQARISAFLDAIESRAGEIIELIIAEAGATRMLAQFLQYGIPMQHARTAVELSGRPAITPLPVETTPNAQGTTTLGGGVQVRDPAGVVAAITPYNFPFFLNIGKIVPAMLMGCTVILKPSPYTPFQALILAEMADVAGLPKGVLNIVTGGKEVGEALTTDPRVDLVSFTGSDTVGSAIQAQSAPTLKRVLLELGGKSALIVRPDADIEAAAMAGLMGFTIHAGQGCALLTRHLVHNTVRERYTAILKAMVGHIKLGDPADPATGMGPLIRDVARQRTERYVEIAKAEGARLVAGGSRPAGLNKGFFHEPTVFDNVENSHRIAQEEVFGPIGVIIGYDSDDEAIALANESAFGLSGGIFSADVGRAYEMALQLRTGGVSINGGGGRMSSYAPFGGIKRSGYGREYGIEGLNEFTTIKTISFKGG
ncbi:MAG: aldehyde dehydrogenase family protein [Sphingomonas sp.]